MDFVHPPSVDCFAWFMKGLKDSATEPEGIPYSCYKALPRFSAWLFYCCNWILLSGGLLGVSFNIQRACFIPKNSSTEGALPLASELRSLGLKNADNKIITGANFRQFSALISERAIYLQRGFIMLRQLALNIVDLDSIIKALGNFNHFNDEAALALWDFQAAFPSVTHAWIQAVFRFYGFPEGFLHFLSALLFHNFAIFSGNGPNIFLYLILAGIVQGCPSAGSCFAIAADPFFYLLACLQDRFPDNHQHSHLNFRGCASVAILAQGPSSAQAEDLRSPAAIPGAPQILSRYRALTARGSNHHCSFFTFLTRHIFHCPQCATACHICI